MSDGVNFHSSRDSNSKIGEALTYRLQESLLQRVNMPSSDMPCRVHALELFHQWLQFYDPVNGPAHLADLVGHQRQRSFISLSMT